MFSSAFIFALLPAALAMPQYGGYGGSNADASVSAAAPSSTASAAGPIHTIDVGLGGLAFSPSNISAAVGDTVVFVFHAKNHTATQSSFASPCQPLAAAAGAPAPFDSGFMPVNASLTSGFPTYNYTVVDTKPVWAYCKQAGPPAHCEAGMVFSINANETSANNFAAYQAKAKGGASATNASASASGSAPAASKTGGAAENTKLSVAAVLGGVALLASLL